MKRQASSRAASTYTSSVTRDGSRVPVLLGDWPWPLEALTSCILGRRCWETP